MSDTKLQELQMQADAQQQRQQFEDQFRQMRMQLASMLLLEDYKRVRPLQEQMYSDGDEEQAEDHGRMCVDEALWYAETLLAANATRDIPMPLLGPSMQPEGSNVPLDQQAALEALERAKESLAEQDAEADRERDYDDFESDPDDFDA